MTIPTIGILGAGKLGVVLAQLALQAGYKVYLAGSGDPAKIALTTKILTPGAVATTASIAAQNSDVIILAMPLGKFRTIPKDGLKGKLVIDAMNHWWEVDGERDNHIADAVSSSEAVQAFLLESRVVKAFSHMGYHNLHDETKPPGAVGRKAIAIAGDHHSDVITVSKIVDKLGFDPVMTGPLASGVYLEPGHDAFGANVNAATLRRIINSRVTAKSTPSLLQSK